MRNLNPYALRTLRLFEDQPEHPGLIVAAKELAALLADSLERVRRREALTADVVQFARLAAHGVEGRHILALQCAVGQFDKDHPNHIVGPVAYRFAVARAVCSLSARLSGKHRIPLGATALDALGSLLIERYSGLAGAVASHFENIAAAQRTRGQFLCAPFSATPARGVAAD